MHLPARRRPVILGRDGEVLAYAQALNLVESDRVDRVAVLDNEASFPRHCLSLTAGERQLRKRLGKLDVSVQGPLDQPESDDRGSTVWGQAGAESYRNETAREIGSSTHFERNAARVATAREHRVGTEHTQPSKPRPTLWPLPRSLVASRQQQGRRAEGQALAAWDGGIAPLPSWRRSVCQLPSSGTKQISNVHPEALAVVPYGLKA